MKPGRQSVILEIIAEKDIETQHQLMLALAERGIKSTQATLSRDIKDMRLIKQLGPKGNYRYVAPESEENDSTHVRLRTIFMESVTAFDLAENLLVIKTLPGLASAACSAIDTMRLENLVGSIAGDDTAFLAMKDKESAQKLYQEIKAIFGK